MDAFDEKLNLFSILFFPGKICNIFTCSKNICRRAERSLVFLNESEEVRPEFIKYLNRLSDYLFVLARYISKLNNEPEEYWNPNEIKYYFSSTEMLRNLSHLEQYGLIACTDGAFHYLKRMNFPLDKLDFISGDFDSHSGLMKIFMKKNSFIRRIRTIQIFIKL
jgi:hypothetical protein